MNQYIPLVFCFDANFANFAAVSSYSAFINSDSLLKIYWVIPSKDFYQVDLVRNKLISHNINISIKLADDSHFSDWKEVQHIKKAAYLRLLIPEIIEEDKVIYLDSDTIIQSDLWSLYNTDLKDTPIAGVLDLHGVKQVKIPLVEPFNYINSGVLVMDLNYLRKDNFLSKCKLIYEKYSDKIVWSDQCIINKYSDGKKTFIEPRWNYFIWSFRSFNSLKIKQLQQKNRASILHFLSDVKPWQKFCSPEIANLWWSYADRIKLENLKREPYSPRNGIKRGFFKRIKDSFMKRFSKKRE